MPVCFNLPRSFIFSTRYKLAGKKNSFQASGNTWSWCSGTLSSTCVDHTLAGFPIGTVLLARLQSGVPAAPVRPARSAPVWLLSVQMKNPQHLAIFEGTQLLYENTEDNIRVSILKFQTALRWHLQGWHLEGREVAQFSSLNSDLQLKPDSHGQLGTDCWQIMHN